MDSYLWGEKISFFLADMLFLGHAILYLLFLLFIQFLVLHISFMFLSFLFHPLYFPHTFFPPQEPWLYPLDFLIRSCPDWLHLWLQVFPVLPSIISLILTAFLEYIAYLIFVFPSFWVHSNHDSMELTLLSLAVISF